MSTAEAIRTLADELCELINKNITPDGECLFDSVKVKLALEFVKLEIEKSVVKGSKQNMPETD